MDPETYRKYIERLQRVFDTAFVKFNTETPELRLLAAEKAWAIVLAYLTRDGVQYTSAEVTELKRLVAFTPKVTQA